MDYFIRTKSLLGKEKFDKLVQSKVLVIGLGGVGGTAFEALVRSGVSNIVGIDFDNVSESNVNRQILYTRHDIGMSKAVCAFKRAKDINEECNVETLSMKIDENTISGLDNYDFDFAVDAIDDINAKVLLVKYFLKRGIPFVSSLGMGNRTEMDKVSVTSLNKTHDDPLARKFRYLLRNEGIDIKDVHVIFSENDVIKTEVNYVSSVMMSPSAAGLCAVSYFIKEIL